MTPRAYFSGLVCSALLWAIIILAVWAPWKGSEIIGLLWMLFLASVWPALLLVVAGVMISEWAGKK